VGNGYGHGPWVGTVDPAQLWVGYGYSCQAQCRTLMITNLFGWVIKFIKIQYQAIMLLSDY